MIQRVLAIIVDYRTTDEAERLSLQVKKSTRSGDIFQVEVIHVDNGNPIPAQSSPAQKSLGVQVLSTGKNLGYAGAINFAVKSLAGQQPDFDAFWILNSDLQIDPNCLSILISVLNKKPQVGAVGPLILKGTNTLNQNNQVWGVRGVISPWLGTTAMTDWTTSGVLPKWSYLPGCSILVRAEAYRALGGLPDFYKLYYEETEFCVQLQKRNWEIWAQRDAVVYHEVHSLKAGVPARHFAYYFIRNNLAFWKVNFGIPIWIQFPRTFYVLCREVILPLRRAPSLSIAWDRLKYALAGLIDGISFSKQRKSHFEDRLFQ